MQKEGTSNLVKIDAVIFYIVFGIIALGGLVGIVGSMIGKEVIFPPDETLTFDWSIIFLLIGIAGLFISHQLWKNKKWSKWLFLVVSGLSVLEVIREMVQYPFVRGHTIPLLVLVASVFVFITLLIKIKD